MSSSSDSPVVDGEENSYPPRVLASQSPGREQSAPLANDSRPRSSSDVSSTADVGRSHALASSPTLSTSRKHLRKKEKVMQEFSKHRGDGAGAPLEPKRVWLRSPHWLTPSYRSKNEEFRKLFKQLPADAMLIDDYSCAVQKEILIHGRMYVSQEHLCFHSNIFGYETSIVIRLSMIENIIPEKTAHLIPNALRIGLKSGRVSSSGKEKDKSYWFASFMSRDTSFTVLMKVWQNVLMGNPMTPINLRHFACRCWGDKPDVDLISQSKDSDEDTDDQPNSNEENGDQSDDTDVEADDEGKVECGCESHVESCFVNQIYPVCAENLFNLFFANSDWWQRLSEKRKLTDMQTSEWSSVEDGKGEIRNVVYTMPMKASIGPRTSVTTEQQHLMKSTPGRLYKVRVEVTNAGVPYSDNFYTYVEYCITYVTRRSAHLRIGACMRFRKSMMGFIKSMIERQAADSMKEFYTMLKKSLAAETATKRKRGKKAAPGEAGKEEENEEALEGSNTEEDEESTASAEKRRFPSLSFLQVLLLVFSLLLLLNLGLIARVVLFSNTTVPAMVQPLPAGGLPDTVDGWRDLLIAQRQQQQAQIADIRQTLDMSGQLLAQVIQSLDGYASLHSVPDADSLDKLQQVKESLASQ